MIRVLIVDDDFMVALVHKGFVERVPGFAVVGVEHTGEAGLEAVARLRPDLVLLDIYLPDISGLEVLRRLREGGLGEVDVLAITAAKDVSTIRAAMRGGVVQYVIKPFTFEMLRDRLERYGAALQRLTGRDEAAQSDVDELFHKLSPARVPMAKGLNETTAALVASVLRESGTDLSAAECAEKAGLSRVSTRRYLEHLVQSGKAKVRMRYGGTGRPEHRYQWVR